MTIRFLRDYQGYSSGSEVSTLSTRQEDAIIAAGAATRTLGDQQLSIYPSDAAGGVRPEDGPVRLVNGSLVSGDGTSVLAVGLALAPVSTPVGFRWTDHGLTLRRTANGAVQTDWLITDLIPTPSVTYYVDPINGSDANSGLTTGLPLLNLPTALAKSDVDQVQIINLTGDYIALGAKSWNNTSNQARSIAVLNRTGYRYISVAAASAPTWTVNGTYSNVFQTTISAANSSNVTDLKVKAKPTYVNAAGATVSVAAPKRFRTLVKVASIAAVSALAGSYYHDGTVLYVRAHDDRNLVGDLFMYPTTTSNNGRFRPTAASLKMYVENIDFVGGGRAFFVETPTITATGGASGGNTITTASTSGVVNGQSITGTGVPANTTVVSFVANTSITISNNLTTTASGTYSLFWTGIQFSHNNCTFQGGGAFAGGFAVSTNATVWGYRSGFYDNYLDGANYHNTASDSANDTNSPKVLELECAGIGNGTTGDTGISNNASTSHEACSVISLNCEYVSSNDSLIVDVNFAHRWMMGGYVGQSVTVASGRQNVKVSNTAKTWLDGVFAASGSNERWMSESSTSTLYYFNSGAVTNASAGLGVVRAYLG